MKISDFDFELPNELIAQYPLPNRAASKMLVVRGGELADDFVANFPKFLRPGDVVVMNDSRVIPSRFLAVAANGKTYEITLHTNATGAWLGMCRGSAKLQPGDLLELQTSSLSFPRLLRRKRVQPVRANETLGISSNLIEIIAKHSDGSIEIKFPGDPLTILEQIGKIPLPPYMKRSDEESDRERYQTIYANAPGSFAAPTAGLHFTPELLAAIEKAGAKIVKITLHVGAGTFMPVKSEDTDDHKMHSEFGTITQEQSDIINAAGRIIAVGTTSLRLLESAGGKAFNGTTDIFITPGYRFKTADVLLTNFHLPKSTLFMLVSAFAGLPEMQAAYAHAILEKYRFFSYGDCCLIYRK